MDFSCGVVVLAMTGIFPVFDIPHGENEAFIWYATTGRVEARIWITCAEVKNDVTDSFGFVNELLETEVAGAWVPYRGVQCQVVSSPQVEVSVLVCEEVNNDSRGVSSQNE